MNFQDIDRIHKMRNGDLVACRNCKGKGHILDSAVLFFPIFGWILALTETNDRDGLSRDTCSTCKGKGYVWISVES